MASLFSAHGISGSQDAWPANRPPHCRAVLQKALAVTDDFDSCQAVVLPGFPLTVRAIERNCQGRGHSPDSRARRARKRPGPLWVGPVEGAAGNPRGPHQHQPPPPDRARKLLRPALLPLERGARVRGRPARSSCTARGSRFSPRTAPRTASLSFRCAAERCRCLPGRPGSTWRPVRSPSATSGNSVGCSAACTASGPGSRRGARIRSAPPACDAGWTELVASGGRGEAEVAAVLPLLQLGLDRAADLASADRKCDPRGSVPGQCALAGRSHLGAPRLRDGLHGAHRAGPGGGDARLVPGSTGTTLPCGSTRWERAIATPPGATSRPRCSRRRCASSPAASRCRGCATSISHRCRRRR